MKPESLHFDMGQYRAVFPTDRRYARNHMWARAADSGWRFGFTAYAVRLLQDVYFLDWIVDAGDSLSEKQEMGQIESKKAEASLYAPIRGSLARFNDVLLADPSAINVDGYGAGWLFEMTGDDSLLLEPAAYLDHLTAVWEVTQRTIKGQLNQ